MNPQTVRRSRRTYISLAAAVAAVLARTASAQTSGAFTFSGDLGLGNSDALVGLSTSKTYVGAYNLGQGDGNVTINGVLFTGVPGINPSAAGVFGTTGLTNQHPGSGAVPGGQLGVLTTAFVYGGTTVPEVFTFNNLTVGQTYVVSFYSKAWDTGARTQNLSAAGASLATTTTYNQNTAPVVGSLNVLRYTFQAASATQTLTFAQAVSGTTNHQYGFSLEQTFNNTWNSGATWTTSTWTGGAATAPNSAGSNANFTAQGAPTTIDLDANRTVGHIQFDGANPWTISSSGGNVLTLQTDVGGAATLSALSGSHTIAPNITLSSPNLLKLGAGSVTLAGNITGGTSTVQVGGGTLILQGTNTYTGETIIGNGTLEVKTVSDYGVASAIGSRALTDENTTLTGVGLHFQGGTLKFTGSTAQSTNRNIRIINGPTGGTIDASGTTPSATLSFTKTGANINLFETGGTRTLTLTGSNTGDNSFSIPLTNESANATSLTKSGPGTWVLNGPDANSATGLTTVSNGALKLAKTAVIAVSGNLSIGTGATPALVQLVGTGGNQIADTSMITFAGSGANSGTLRLNNLSESVGSLSSTGGAGIVENESGIAGTVTLGLSGTDTQTFSGIIRDGDGTGTDGTLALTKSGAGSQTLSGNNSYSGVTTLTGGTLAITHANALGSATAGTVQSGASELRISGGITTAAEPISINGGGINNAGAIRNFADTNTYAGTLTLAAQSRIVSDSGTLIFSSPTAITGTNNLVLSGAGNFTINGAIATGTGSVNKDNLIGGGTGMLTLAGANTFTGLTSITAGTLRLDYSSQDNSKLSDGAALILGNAAVELAGGAHPEIVGSTTLNANTFSSVSRVSGNAVLHLNAVTVGAGASINIAADNITSTDNLNVNGLLPGFRRGSTWAVNSTNGDDGLIVAFTGYTDVNRLGGVIPNGILNNPRVVDGGAGGNVTLGAASNVVNSLQVDATAGVTTVQFTTPSDVLIVGGDTGGTVWHQANAGGLTIGTTPNEGVLTSGETSNGVPAVLTLSNDSTTKSLTVNSAITDNGTDVVSVVKSGPGVAILAGNNSFSNPVIVAGGTLVLTGNNSARPTNVNGLTTVNNGTVLQLQANAGNTTGGISTVLGSEQTVNQPLIVNSGGTLQLRSDSSVTFAGGNNFGGLGSATVTIDVDRLSAGTNNTLTLAPLGYNVNTTTLNVTGGNGYTLATGPINNVAGSGVMTLNPTTGNLRIGGYTAGATLSTTLVLGGTAAGNSITGAVANPPTSGATTLTKTGTSTWTLNGADSYSGALTVSGGTLNLAGAKTGTVNGITVSNLAGTNATLGISNGTYALGGTNFFVANAPTTVATGTVNQSGGSVTFTGGNAILMGNANIANTAIYNLSGGSITTFASASRGIILGVNNSAISTFNLSGTGVINMTAASGASGDGVLQVGRYDSANANTTSTFAQTGGTANIGILSIGGNGTTGTGLNTTLTLNGGTFSANQFPRLSLGNSNTAVINIGGTADVTLPAFPTARGTSSTAVLNFDGGTLRPAAASTAFISGLNNAFIKAGGAKFDVASGRDITITQNLLTDTVSTGGGLTKAGPGVLTLTGTNTYTGLTSVSAGSLIVTGTVSGSSTTNVLAGATLGGTGTMGPVGVAANGIVAPGVAVGTLNTQAFTLASTAMLRYELGTPGIVGGTTNDLISVTGALTLDGTLQITPLAGFNNGSYRLFNFTGALTDNVLSLEAAFLSSYPGSFIDSTTPNQVNLVVVPEPASAITIIGGLGVLATLRRRRS